MVRDRYDPTTTDIVLEVPQRPQLQGAYTAFLSKDKEVVLLSNAAIKIVRVKDLSAVPLPSFLYVGFASDFQQADGTKGIVIRGDVDVEIDRIQGSQTALLALQARHGDLKHIAMHFDGVAVRGPPEVQRPPPVPVTVYIVGEVKTFSGPEQYGQSKLVASVIDLSPTEADYAEYLRKSYEWESEVQKRASSYGQIPRSELWGSEVDSGRLKLHIEHGVIYPTRGTPTEKFRFEQEFGAIEQGTPNKKGGRRPSPSRTPKVP